jgi:hypothetical protein
MGQIADPDQEQQIGHSKNHEDYSILTAKIKILEKIELVPAL